MRSIISVAVSPKEIAQTRHTAKHRGFSSTSDYIRHLLQEDQESLISEEEILRRAKRTLRLHAEKKLVSASSIKQLRDL